MSIGLVLFQVLFLSLSLSFLQNASMVEFELLMISVPGLGNGSGDKGGEGTGGVGGEKYCSC